MSSTKGTRDRYRMTAAPASPTSNRWARLLEDLLISERALREFFQLNPEVPWRDTATVLHSRLAGGQPRRRRHQRHIELVDGRQVPLDYIEIVIRGRQVAIIRKDKLVQNELKSVRAIGSVRNGDPGHAKVRAQRRAA